MQVLLNLTFEDEIAASNFIVLIDEVLKASRIFLNARF
jgi:predicted ATP-binding protein involved in virulence